MAVSGKLRFELRSITPQVEGGRNDMYFYTRPKYG